MPLTFFRRSIFFLEDLWFRKLVSCFETFDLNFHLLDRLLTSDTGIIQVTWILSLGLRWIDPSVLLCEWHQSCCRSSMAWLSRLWYGLIMHCLSHQLVCVNFRQRINSGDSFLKWRISKSLLWWGISKFLLMVFLTYHGASTIVLGVLFWTTWIFLQLILTKWLQSAAPYNMVDVIIVRNNNLLFLGLLQRPIPSYFNVLSGIEKVDHRFALVRHIDYVSLLSKISPKYFIWCSRGILVHLNSMAYRVVTRYVVNITVSLLSGFFLISHLSAQFSSASSSLED